MRALTMDGMIERRLLINYRVDPDAVSALLPQPFRPQVVHGYAVAGICLLRLGQLRPHPLPSWMGLRSENAAHRIAVEWDTSQGRVKGVYIPRRDSDSVVNVGIGGRFFPGRHYRAKFAVHETDEALNVTFGSVDGSTAAQVEARIESALEKSELFRDLDEASQFFRAGSAGYSDGADPESVEGVKLFTDAWRIEPLEVDFVSSSFFEDSAVFPSGSAELDCGLVMRSIPVTWKPLPPMGVHRHLARVLG
jgi:hypothetical protein